MRIFKKDITLKNQTAVDLLAALSVAAPDAMSSALTLTWLENLEGADPNGDDGEENKGWGWGHTQFAANGGMDRVLASWASVGSAEVVYRLLAVGIKTCLVSHHYCTIKNLPHVSHVSEVYLRELVQKLWDLWEVNEAVSITQHP